MKTSWKIKKNVVRFKEILPLPKPYHVYLKKPECQKCVL